MKSPLLVVLVLALASPLHAVDLVGARAAVKVSDRAGIRRDSAVIKLGRDAGIATPMPDPTAQASRLRISAATAGTFELPLATARWRSLRRGFRYDGAAGDPVRSINLVSGESGGAILIRTRGSLVELSGDEPPAHVEVRLSIGEDEYCARLATPSATRTVRGQGLLAFRGTATACRQVTHSCAIDAATSGTTVRNPTTAFGAMAGGRLTFTCDEFDAQTMRASCSCRAEIEPVLLPGVGDLCMTAGPGCRAGNLDCAAGALADVDVVSDHNIGVCADNADCAAACSSRCAGLGQSYRPILSGCEAFCAGGINDGLPCSFAPDCPGGFCAGRDDGSSGRSCHCVCSASAVGTAAVEPSLTCNARLGLSIETDGDGVCGNGDAVLTIAPVCQALTSSTATVIARNVINVTNFHLGPFSISGAPPACPNVVGGATPLSLVGNYTTFGRVTADELFEWVLTCE